MILWPGTPAGQVLFTIAKVWVFVLPALWFVGIERRRPSWSRPRLGGFGMAVASGLAIGGIIAVAYFLALRGFIDAATARASLGRAGLDRAPVYAGLAAYWIIVNSVLEEYLWRWFVVREAEALCGRRWAIAISALGFTAHHLVAASVYLPTSAVLLVGLGVAVGGAWWSWMYVRYRSIWPAWVSHALADVAVFSCGAHLVFAR
jgi:membrane protease YdiL (CAAX protease family)